MSLDPRRCTHMNFAVKAQIARIEDIGRFVAEIKIACKDCGTPFEFMGIGLGFNYEAPNATIDHLEAHLPICPQGARPGPHSGPVGYQVKFGPGH